MTNRPPTTTKTCSDTEPRPSLDEAADFLSRYAVWLFGSGCTCIRLEKNLNRMARAAGFRVEFSILPRHIHLTLYELHGRASFTAVSSIKALPVSFDVISRLSRLSWDMADGHADYSSAVKQFETIIGQSRGRRQGLPLLVGLANASFCRLFGGDAVAMLIVFAATVAGFILKEILTERHVDIRITVVACSFLSAVLAAADGLFGLGTTPSLAISASVLYLVPGIPFLNSFSDMIDGHYICAFGRMMNAVVITCCLSLGLCCGMAVMKIGMF